MDIMKMGKNPNYLGSWDLEELPGAELTVTINKIVDEKVPTGGKEENCTVCYFKENFKPMILNITNKKTLCRLYKTKSTEKLEGKRITVFIAKVKAFGSVHDALRIKSIIPPDTKEKYEKCEKCGGDILPAFGMTSAEFAEYSLKNCGKKLCSQCAKEEAKARKAEQTNE